jgi:hypothetical protein
MIALRNRASAQRPFSAPHRPSAAATDLPESTIQMRGIRHADVTR